MLKTINIQQAVKRLLLISVFVGFAGFTVTALTVDVASAGITAIAVESEQQSVENAHHDGSEKKDEKKEKDDKKDGGASCH